MDATSFPLVDAVSIVRLVGRAAADRARAYQRLGAVAELAWDAEGQRLTSRVQGSEFPAYECSVTLTPGPNGFSKPLTGYCSCPVGGNCKHVAATLLASNLAHVTAPDSSARQTSEPHTGEPHIGEGQPGEPTTDKPLTHAPRTGAPLARDPKTGVLLTGDLFTDATNMALAGIVALRTQQAPQPPKKAAQPSWKTALSAIQNAGSGHGPGGSDGSSGHGGPRISHATPLGLMFEIREQTKRSRDSWRGPTAQTVTATTPPGGGSRRLAVRPAIRSASGNWVKANVTWTSFAYQSQRLNLDAEQSRWFSEFAALSRATPAVFMGHETDWIFLDDFSSPLLWPLLTEAARLGIPLLAGKKDATVTRGEAASVTLDAASDSKGKLTLSPVIAIDAQPIASALSGAIGDHGIYSYSFGPQLAVVFAPTAEPLGAERRALLASSKPLVIPAADVDEFLTGYYPTLRRRVEITTTDASVTFPQVEPAELVLTASFAAAHSLTLDWNWRGDVDEGARQPILFRVTAMLRGTPLDVPGRELVTSASFTMTGLDAALFSEKTLPAIEALDGVRVFIEGTRPDYRELTDAPELTISTLETDRRDWFDLGVLVKVEGRSVPFGPLFTALVKGKTKLLLIDGSYLSLQQPAFDRLRELISEAGELTEWETRGPRISRYQASLWADFEDLSDETVQASAWRDAVAGLNALAATGIDGVEPVPVPAGVAATLRPYQVEGFQWLAFLWRQGLGGILADDMGLGKTLQALALIQLAVDERPALEPVPASAPRSPSRSKSKSKSAAALAAESDPVSVAAPDSEAGSAPDAGVRKPFLVVAPTSVVGNWLIEAARFTPGLDARPITATSAKSGRSIAELSAGADIVVTSYTLFRLDFESYSGIKWAGFILDEAQFVKNHASAAHRAARDLDAPFKLVITGTPMENNLMELFSLFAITAPGLFASQRRFTEEYVRPIEGANGGTAGTSQEGDPGGERLARLRRRIRPLMMRRTKELVAPELPPKQEQVLAIDLAPKHRKLYDTVLQRERQKLLGLIDDMDKNRFIIFRSLTLLRMLSLDASLVDSKYEGIPSSKLDALLEQLDDVVAEGHRALIFSQFTSFLGKAAERLDAAGIAYEYLDGSSTKRPAIVKRFKTGTAPVFLISLKAGGFGLNLTEADYVFLLDPWWNPATESQAIDRTHRIGQTRSVNVYRMVATGTIEEKVMALKEKKAKLFDAVLDDEAVFSSALSADDIRSLLG